MSDLRELAAKIATRVGTEPSRAVEVHETLLAGCYEKAEEIDDSSGSFGQFVGELHCASIKARQAAGAAADDTAVRLLAWMDDDPYGFCHQLGKDAAKVLDKAGRAALEKLIRARFDATATEKPTHCGSFRNDPAYQRRRCGEILRALYTEQKNVEAYVALAEATEWTPQDCQTLATLLVARRKPGEALSWVKRGMALAKKTSRGSMAGYQLARLRRDLLRKLGRGNEALEAAKGADLHSLVELLLEIRELERLADLVRRTRDAALEDVSHYATEPAAKRLQTKHPDAAARLWRAQGMRILNAKKSKYYDSALESFERAKRCYQRAGLTAEWAKIVSRVRESHHRKMGFMSGFESLVAGSGPSRAPSFLERAKTTWGERQPRHGP